MSLNKSRSTKISIEIAPGLHQLQTPMNTPGLPFVMPYLFEYPEGLVLFDAGYGTKSATRALEEELKNQARVMQAHRVSAEEKRFVCLNEIN